MLKQEDIDKIGKSLVKHAITEWPVNDDLKISAMASGSYAILDKSGGKIKPEDLSESQSAAIKKEFNFEGGGGGGHDFDTNPLIPSDDTMAEVRRIQKRTGKKSEFDTNPLIPD